MRASLPSPPQTADEQGQPEPQQGRAGQLFGAATDTSGSEGQQFSSGFQPWTGAGNSYKFVLTRQESEGK